MKLQVLRSYFEKTVLCVFPSVFILNHNTLGSSLHKHELHGKLLATTRISGESLVGLRHLLNVP